MNTTPLVPLMMFGWPLVALALFTVLTPRRAAFGGIIGGWLFLPHLYGVPLPHLPDYDRTIAMVIGSLAGMLVFDYAAVSRLRLHWIDLPILAWLVSPLLTSVSNGLGVYDGLSWMLTQFFVFGAPYFVARVYCTSPAAARDLLYVILAGALVYAPFALLEVRLSPQLHKWVYGYHQVKFHTAARLGGYRPNVFLRTGIELGAFFSVAAFALVWLSARKAARSLLGVPIAWLAVGMTLALLLSRALNGYGLFVIGCATAFALSSLRTRWLVIAVMLGSPAYITMRLGGEWTADRLVDALRTVSEKRASSLRSRLAHEVLLVEHAWSRPLLGWGTYGRNRATFLKGELPEGAMGNRSITDSLWIIAFGQNGFFGLAALWGALLLPAACFFLRAPPSALLSVGYAPVVLLAIVATLFTIDGLFNAMVGPVYFLATGAVASCVAGSALVRAGAGAPLHARRVQGAAR